MTRPHKRIHAIIATLLCLLVNGTAAAPRDSVAPVVEANTAFALDLYRALADSTGDNLFFSPYSVSTALAQTFLGAANETRAEMRRVLHLPPYDGKVYSGFSRLMSDVNNRTVGDSASLFTANATWLEQTLLIEDKFRNHSERFYGSAFHPVNFITGFEPARIDINDWVAEQTRDKIVDLLPPGSLNSDTRLVLASAIYFKAGWDSPFKNEQTDETIFHAGNGNEVTVPVMRQAADLAYYEDSLMQMVRLPYGGHQISMLVLLPRDGIGALESSLDTERLATAIAGLDANAYRVVVYLPRFAVTHQVTLNDALVSLGMTSAFNESADFSGITTEAKLFIGGVFHKAYIAVDEEGTEAAAATAVTIGTTSVKPPRRDVTFRADHPFVFMIVDEPTHTILFLGRMSNPATVN